MFRLHRLVLAVFLALAGLSSLPAGADATERQRDRVYADSFGNLVIYSHAGYKRIIVGKGHLADKYADYSTDNSSGPSVVRLDEDTASSCPPALLKGNSQYLYRIQRGDTADSFDNCY